MDRTGAEERRHAGAGIKLAFRANIPELGPKGNGCGQTREHQGNRPGESFRDGNRITSYNVCYTKLLRA